MSLTVKDSDEATQLRLLEEPDLIRFPSPASARTRYGECVEQIACKALRADNITIDGRYDVCYDCKRGETYYEVKSVRSSGECPIYEWRLEKDSSCFKEVFYAFVLHNCRNCKDSLELWSRMSETVKDLYVVPLSSIIKLHQRSKLESIHGEANSRNGYERAGYCRGYRRIKMSDIKALNHQSKGRRFKLHGYSFNLKIHTAL